MSSRQFELTLQGLSQSDRAQALAEMIDMLADSNPDGSAKLRQDHATAQDFGATVVLVLGTGAAVAVAKGIGALLAKWNGATLDIKDGRIIATGLTSKDALKMALGASSSK